MDKVLYSQGIFIVVSSDADALRAGVAIDAIERVVLEVLSSVLGSQPGLDVPLVQAGLDSLGTLYPFPEVQAYVEVPEHQCNVRQV